MFPGFEILVEPTGGIHLQETSSVPALLQPQDPELKKQVKTNKIAVEDEENMEGNIERNSQETLKKKIHLG